MPHLDELGIDARGIRLGQLLKLWGVVGTGGDAKQALSAGEVSVNGRPETRRGAQLQAGDVVGYAGHRVRLVGPAPGTGEVTAPGPAAG